MAKKNSKKSLKNPDYRPIRENATASKGLWVFLGILCFFTIALTGSFDRTLEKTVAFIACFIVLLSAWRLKDPERIQRFFTPTAIALYLFILVGGISTFYAVAGKFAISEYAKLLVAFCVFTLILFQAKDNEKSLRRICTVFSGVCAVYSLLSIDAASSKLLSRLFYGFMGLFTQNYVDVATLEKGIRINSVFSTPNIFAGFAALGILLAIYLSHTSSHWREKWYQLSFLAVSSLAFLLTFSMGATLWLALAVVAFFVFASARERAAYLILMLETASITLLMTFSSFGTLGEDGVVAFLPLVAAIGACLLLCLCERFAGEKLTEILKEKEKYTLLFCGGALALVLLFVAAAANISGAANMAQSDSLRRAAYPAPGNYTLTVDSDAPLNITIESQNRQEVMMHKSTFIYSGTSEAANFTVPADSEVVYFNFHSPEATTLKKAAYIGDGGQGELHLAYPLLPDFIANRLQGLFANQNAVQRFVFFYDGLKLFARSPVTGLGLGGFENAIFSTQDFFYETKYAHNHYVQVLAEMGLLGILPYLSLLIASAVALVCTKRRQEQETILPVLAACFIFIIGHSAIEVVMSSGVFLPVAFGIFAMITICCDKPLLKSDLLRQKSSYLKIPKISLTAFSLLFIILLGGNFTASSISKATASTPEEFFSNMTRAAKLDIYDTNDYLLSYVISAPYSESQEILTQAEIYAERLSKVKSNTIQGRLAEFYLIIGDPEKAFAMAEQILNYRKADQNTWVTQFALFETYYDQYRGDFYEESLLNLYAMMQEANRNRMEKLSLPESTMGFLYALGRPLPE